MEFVRTINTSDAFNIKMGHLEKELADMLKERARYDDAGIGNQFGSGFLKFFSGLFFTIGFLIIGIAGFGYLAVTPSDDDIYFSAGLFIGAVILFIALIINLKANKQLRIANEKIRNVRVKKERLDREIAQLRFEIDEQKEIFERHMMNQQDLITAEVRAIKQLTGLESDSKECPQCAETVKFRAKICRYCSYTFTEGAV